MNKMLFGMTGFLEREVYGFTVLGYLYGGLILVQYCLVYGGKSKMLAEFNYW